MNFVEPGEDSIEMKAIQLQPHQFEAWDAFVADDSRGTLYHESRWKAILETAFPHMNGRFIALVNTGGGSIVAGMPIYEVGSWILGKRLV